MPDFTPAARAKVIALVAHPYDSTIETTWTDWPLPTGDIGWPTENQFSLLGAETDVRVATEGFTSKPAHTPADTFYGPYITEPFLFGVKVMSGTEPTGPISPSAGTGTRVRSPT